MANILVVDDEVDVEPLIRQRFRHAVRAGKINLLFAHDGEQALEIIDATPDIELIITDINMPVMDGLTLLERLSERAHLTARSIIISAYGDMANIRAGMNRGAFDFITKPISFEDLERTMERALDKGRMDRLAREAHVQVLEIQKEFDLARRVQMGILPRPWPLGGPEDLVGFMRPAREVGGDAFDFIPINEDHVGFAIADVAGKGIAAAMVASVTHALVRVLASDLLDPAECVARLNQFMAAHNPEMLFVTMLYCVLDRRTGVVSYANAGHPWPLMVNSEGVVSPLTGTISIPVGITNKANWSTMTVALKPGERLFLFTDGLTEAVGASGEHYGEERLSQNLQALAHEAPGELMRKLIVAIDEFTGSEQASDDMTCLMLDWHGRGHAEATALSDIR
jgi:sigma-B regulation protein RsbU (phosphoserine phosphatase)